MIDKLLKYSSANIYFYTFPTIKHILSTLIIHARYHHPLLDVVIIQLCCL